MKNKTDNQIHADIVKEVKRIIYFNQVERAFEFHEKTIAYLKKKGFARSNQELYQKYQRIIVKLKWVSLSYHSKETVIGLFRTNIKDAFDIPDFDLWEKLRTFLLQFKINEDRDKVKKAIVDALNGNESLLVSKKLISGKKPTVGNWIREYITIVGLGKVETIKLQNFFIKNKNFRALDSKEQERVKSFFNFYERIKLSSLSWEGMEDSVEIVTSEFVGSFHDGKVDMHEKMSKADKKLLDICLHIVERTEAGILGQKEEKKVVVDVDKLEIDGFKKKAKEKKENEQKLAELELLLAKYPDNSLERKLVEEEIIKFKKIK